MVVFAIKTQTKAHTYLERKFIFFLGGGLPQQKIWLPFWRPLGAPDTVKYNTFGTPGALSQKTYTQIGPGGVLAIKKWHVWPLGPLSNEKLAFLAPGAI